ncbi:MAG: amidohydrolase family protein [Acidobacteria bacterium]|nr:amidohydrolase family protein [Acidobacteriota bacterium]
MFDSTFRAGATAAVIATLWALGVAFVSAQAPTPTVPSLLIRNVTLVDGNGGTPRSGVNVLLREGLVASVTSAATEEAALTLDGRGLFLLPGLTDAHVHLSGMSWTERTAQLKRVLQGGVTMVYDVASDLRNTSDLARAALVGEIESPTILYAALFAGPAFFTDPRVVATSRGYRPGDAPWNREIAPGTDLVRAVAEARGAGATSIKLYAALDAATVRRIGEEATRQDVRLIAHSTVFPARPSDLVAAGVKYLAHAAYLAWEGSPPTPDFPRRARGDFAGVPADGPVMTRLLQSMKDNDVALNPTLWIFAEGPGKDDLASLRTPWMFAVTKRAQEMGVTLAAGVDSLTAPGDPLPMIHKELEVMVAGAGLTPLQVITAATRGAAHALGVDDQRGTVAPGKVADLLLVGADPTVNIRATRLIRHVIKAGRIVHSAAPR